MFSLNQVVDSLYTQARPVLTWYGSARVELGGPVLARWFSKTANLLSHEYADLFAPSSGVSQHIVVDLPSCWQKIIWVSTATLCGWTVSVPARQEDFGANDPAGTALVHHELSDAASLTHTPITLYVTERMNASAQQAQADGADILLHNLSPLALRWDDDLPPGAIDALEALMSHSDLLEDVYEAVAWPSHAPREHSDEPALHAPGAALSDPQQHRLVLHEANALALYMPLTELWAEGASAIIIDPAYHDDAKAGEITASELPHLR